MPKVRYVRNADPSEGTGAITAKSGTIKIGEEGYLTDEEYAAVVGRVSLEVVGKGDAPSGDEEGQGDGLDDLNQAELRKLAKDENVDTTGLQKNDELVKAIRENRAPPVEAGAQSLPSTAPGGGPGTTVQP